MFGKPSATPNLYPLFIQGIPPKDRRAQQHVGRDASSVLALQTNISMWSSTPSIANILFDGPVKVRSDFVTTVCCDSNY